MSSPSPETLPSFPVNNVTAPPPPTVETTPTTIPTSPPNATSKSPPSPPPDGGSGGMPPGTMVGLIVGIGIGGISMLVAVGVFVFFYKRWKRKRMLEQGFDFQKPGGGPSLDTKYQSSGQQQPLQKIDAINSSPPLPSSGGSSLASVKPTLPPPLSTGISLGFSQSTFTYEELAMATDNFSPASILGQGGFGYVHKGVLPNGKQVAVKQLKAGSGQGEREFRAEVEVISRVHHRHLVSLVGYCISGEQRLLVYEFVPNNTLEFHLHRKGRPTMGWPTRMKIALGSARGLAYLHEDCHPKIIHRDIKAANILLEDNFVPKVADFGLARISSDSDTHVSTRVMGTFGYLAPEYAASGKLTDKSDVFSFGVVLLELVTGRQPIDKVQSFTDDSMVEWARPLLVKALENGDFGALVDQRLQNDYDSSEMTRMVTCAAACVRHSARLRPRMSQIVRALEGNIALDDLNEGVTPGDSTVFGSYGSSGYKASQYKEDLKKFQKLLLSESQEHVYSEGSGPSSEFGQHPSTSSSGQQTTQEIEFTK